MTSVGGIDYSDLVQAAQPSHEVQNLIEGLMEYFNINSIPEKEGWSKVECSFDEPNALDSIRKEFIKEFDGSEIINIIKTIVSPPGKTYYLSRKVQLLAFQSGWSKLDDLVGKDDCIILIPVAISSSIEATIQEERTERRTTFVVTTNSELIITGRCSMWIPPKSKIVCVVFCVAKDKELKST